MTKVCATCRRQPAVKCVPSTNGRIRLWKCQDCIDRKSVSFITAAKQANQLRKAIKDESAHKRQGLEEAN